MTRSLFHPPGSRPGEFLLASFPKSGNTWVSFLVANLFNEISRRVEEVNFHTIHDICPALNRHRRVRPLFDEMPPVYVTHAVYRRSFRNVVLILRDPWDVMYSYFHYLNGERKRQLSLADVVCHEKQGVDRLVQHNDSFLRNCENLLVLTYERLQENQSKEVRRLADFLELTVDADVLASSIRKSSFDSMRDIEVREGRKYGTPGFLFTRKGMVGEGRAAISEDKELNNHILRAVKRSPFLSLLYL